jgi:rSAM-associated Gly-rich repeat protein
MSSSSRVTRALRLVLPGGALGASLVLVLVSSPSAARASAAPAPNSGQGVADRLQAIRAGVAEIGRSGTALAPAPTDDTGVVPTWWGNGGWGRWHFGWGNGGFGWPNWHNWGNGWHNWGNGGWNNGWHNGWHNFWHNY